MKAYQLIEDPKNWTVAAAYRDKDGNSCAMHEAFSYCALGAIEKSCHNEKGVFIEKTITLQFHIAKRNNDSIPTWNDKSTHKEVYETLKKLDI